MAEKNVSLRCVACGYESKGPETLAGADCPNCHQQVLNVASKGVKNWATTVFGKAKAKRKAKK